MNESLEDKEYGEEYCRGKGNNISKSLENKQNVTFKDGKLDCRAWEKSIKKRSGRWAETNLLEALQIM